MAYTNHNLSFVACISRFFAVLAEFEVVVAMFFTPLIFHHFFCHAYPYDVDIDLDLVTRTHAHLWVINFEYA